MESKRQDENEGLNRRQFLNYGAAGVLGIAAIGKFSAAAANRQSVRENPFAYDVRRFARTDPDLIQYKEISRFVAPRSEPRRVAVGPDDQVYLIAGSHVMALSKEGAALSEFSLSRPAGCLAISEEGVFYLGVRDHVEVFTGNGQRKAVWEPFGPKAWLTGVTLSANEVFLTDAGNRIVWRCDASGRLLGRIGAKDKERNVPGFVVPSPYFDLEMHRDGLLRVANPGRHRVEAYTVDGHLELVWGKPSAAIDGFCGCCNPSNIALLPDGRMITCEKGLPRVKIYRDDGTLESVVAGTETFPENAKASTSLAEGKLGALDAAVDSKGRIYVLDPATAIVRVMARKEIAPEPQNPTGRGG